MAGHSLTTEHIGLFGQGVGSAYESATKRDVFHGPTTPEAVLITLLFMLHLLPRCRAEGHQLSTPWNLVGPRVLYKPESSQ